MKIGAILAQFGIFNSKLKVKLPYERAFDN